MMPDRINVKSEPLKWNPHGTARPSTLRIFRKQRSHLWLRYKKALCYNVGTEGTGPAMPSPAVISWESHLMFFGFRAFFPWKIQGPDTKEGSVEMSSQVLLMFRFLCGLSVLENSTSIPGQPFPLKCLCSVFRQLNAKVHLQEAQSSNSAAKVHHVIWRWHEAEASCCRRPGDNEKSMTFLPKALNPMSSFWLVFPSSAGDGSKTVKVLLSWVVLILRGWQQTLESPHSALWTHKYGSTDKQHNDYRWQELDLCSCFVYYCGSFPSLAHWSVTWLLKAEKQV